MAVMGIHAVVRGADVTHMPLELLMKREQHGTKNLCLKKTFTKYLYLRFAVETLQLESEIEEKKHENN